MKRMRKARNSAKKLCKTQGKKKTHTHKKTPKHQKKKKTQTKQTSLRTLRIKKNRKVTSDSMYCFFLVSLFSGLKKVVNKTQENSLL